MRDAVDREGFQFSGNREKEVVKEIGFESIRKGNTRFFMISIKW